MMRAALKALAGIVLISVAFLAGSLSNSIGKWSVKSFNEGGHEESIEQVMKQVSEQINKTTPLMIDKDTRLDSAGFLSGPRFLYVYTLINYSAEDLPWKQAATELSPRLINYACTTMPFLMSKNVEIVYRYRSKDEGLLGDIIVEPSRCRTPTTPVMAAVP